MPHDEGLLTTLLDSLPAADASRRRHPATGMLTYRSVARRSALEATAATGRHRSPCQGIRWLFRPATHRPAARRRASRPRTARLPSVTWSGGLPSPVPTSRHSSMARPAGAGPSCGRTSRISPLRWWATAWSQGTASRSRRPPPREFVAAYLAALQAGLVVVPINPAYTVPELRLHPRRLRRPAAGHLIGGGDRRGRSGAARPPDLSHIVVAARSGADGLPTWTNCWPPARRPRGRAGRRTARRAAGGAALHLRDLRPAQGRHAAGPGAAGQPGPGPGCAAAVDAEDRILLPLPLFHMFGLNAGLGAGAVLRGHRGAGRTVRRRPRACARSSRRAGQRGGRRAVGVRRSGPASRMLGDRFRRASGTRCPARRRWPPNWCGRYAGPGSSCSRGTG